MVSGQECISKTGITGITITLLTHFFLLFFFFHFYLHQQYNKRGKKVLVKKPVQVND